MQRLAIAVEYDGHAYHGWQKQIGKPTIQQNLEDALSKVAAHSITTVCAGRTDAGVHAVGQIVHCDVKVNRSSKAWVLGVNRYLPKNIKILWIREVADTFDARRTAICRRYCYAIYNHKIRPALFRHQISWYHQALDAEIMHMAAQYWLGEHDFSSFRDADCQSISPIRLVNSVRVYRIGDLVFFDIIANAFLHHMVRNMVGVLLKIGTKQCEYTWAFDVLQAKDRRQAGITASPNGLYLIGVQYPDKFALSTINNVPWFFQVIR
jgi:tRNA pseudouridine38-40 synthase